MICPATAGILFMWIASDADNLLRVFRIDWTSGPIASVDCTAFLGLDPTDEADFEGAAVIGDLIFWITSHGAKRDVDEAPARRRLFATRIDAASNQVQVEFVGRPYEGLVEDLASAPALSDFDLAAAAALAPEEEGGLNIEGLAAWDGGLVVGFQNPIPDGKALLVPIDNPRSLVGMDGGEPVTAAVGEPLLLDLDERGIRSIDRLADREAYLILAGPAGDGRGFGLFEWAGPGERAKPIDVDFGKWHPEALVEWPGHPSTVQILSDDGDRKLENDDGEEVRCKDAPAMLQRFRAGWLGLD
jgi:hypothetical protein